MGLSNEPRDPLSASVETPESPDESEDGLVQTPWLWV